jgi:hypothetical protein
VGCCRTSLSVCPLRNGPPAPPAGCEGRFPAGPRARAGVRPATISLTRADIPDGLHPNDACYAKMAVAWDEGPQRGQLRRSDQRAGRRLLPDSKVHLADIKVAKTHQRIRERLPHSPRLVEAAEQHLANQAALLPAASVVTLRWYSGMRAAVQACASALALAPSAGDHLKSGRPHQRSTRQRLARRGRRPADKSRRRNGKADEPRPNQRASASRTSAGVFDRIHQILLAEMNAANRIDWSRSAMDGSATLAWSLNQFPAAQPSKSTP